MILPFSFNEIFPFSVLRKIYFKNVLLITLLLKSQKVPTTIRHILMIKVKNITVFITHVEYKIVRFCITLKKFQWVTRFYLINRYCRGRWCFPTFFARLSLTLSCQLGERSALTQYTILAKGMTSNACMFIEPQLYDCFEWIHFTKTQTIIYYDWDEKHEKETYRKRFNFPSW